MIPPTSMPNHASSIFLFLANFFTKTVNGNQNVHSCKVYCLYTVHSPRIETHDFAIVLSMLKKLKIKKIIQKCTIKLGHMTCALQPTSFGQTFQYFFADFSLFCIQSLLIIQMEMINTTIQLTCDRKDFYTVLKKIVF